MKFLSMYCGAPPITARSLFARDQAGGVPALFKNRHVTYAFNTRTAIREACDLLDLKVGDEVLAPAYNCGSELDALRDANLTVKLYPVDRGAAIDPKQVERQIGPNTRAVYVIHYFGFLQPALAELRSLCDQYGLRLIEDCALSLLSGLSPPAGTIGDVAVYCFYKFFPVWAGGALVVNRPLSREPRFNHSPPVRMTTKFAVRTGAEMVLGSQCFGAIKSLRRRRSEHDALSTTSNPDMPAHYYFDPHLRNTRVSKITDRALGSFNVAQAITTRRANYSRYLELLKEVPNARPLYPNLIYAACPLNMPVFVGNRNRLAAELIARGIPATPWWAGYHRGLDWSGQDGSCHLKNNILTLPSHQYLNESHITYIVHQLKDAIRRLQS